jgi:hypothetical protein
VFLGLILSFLQRVKWHSTPSRRGRCWGWEGCGKITTAGWVRPRLPWWSTELTFCSQKQVKQQEKSFGLSSPVCYNHCWFLSKPVCYNHCWL